jgi:hypothetical protein
MEALSLNPDCEIEQLFYHIARSGINPNSNRGKIMLWFAKRGAGDYNIVEVATGINLSVKSTRLNIVLITCTINATELKLKYALGISGKGNTAMCHYNQR